MDTDTTDLVDMLAREVERRYQEGRPLVGAHVGLVLRDEALKRGRPAGKGAYRPIVNEAIKQRRIRREFTGATDWLLPVNAPQPAISQLGTIVPAKTPISPKRSGRGLKKEIYLAFAGLEAPRYVDSSHPPQFKITAVASGDHPLVEAVPLEKVRDLWNAFAGEQQIPEAEKILAQLDTPAGAWAWLSISGDSADKRWGARFHHRRMELLLSHIREWASQHGIDMDHYELYSPAPERASTTIPQRPAMPQVDLVEELRRRIHATVDRMSLQQLCELKIPSEFLLG